MHTKNDHLHYYYYYYFHHHHHQSKSENFLLYLHHLLFITPTPDSPTYVSLVQRDIKDLSLYFIINTENDKISEAHDSKSKERISGRPSRSTRRERSSEDAFIVKTLRRRRRLLLLLPFSFSRVMDTWNQKLKCYILSLTTTTTTHSSFKGVYIATIWNNWISIKPNDFITPKPIAIQNGSSGFSNWWKLSLPSFALLPMDDDAFPMKLPEKIRTFWNFKDNIIETHLSIFLHAPPSIMILIVLQTKKKTSHHRHLSIIIVATQECNPLFVLLSTTTLHSNITVIPEKLHYKRNEVSHKGYAYTHTHIQSTQRSLFPVRICECVCVQNTF